MLCHNIGDILEHFQTKQVKAGAFLIVIPHALFQRTQVFVDIPAELNAIQPRHGCAGTELHHLTIDLDFLCNCHSLYPPFHVERAEPPPRPRFVYLLTLPGRC